MAYVDDGVGPKLWVIFDPRVGVFWRPGGEGYTSDVVDAGLFSEQFACRMTGPSYADRKEQARHLETFRYMLKDATARALRLSERFALIPTKQCKCPGFDKVMGPYPSGFCKECGEWFPPKLPVCHAQTGEA